MITGWKMRDRKYTLTRLNVVLNYAIVFFSMTMSHVMFVNICLYDDELVMLKSNKVYVMLC